MDKSFESKKITLTIGQLRKLVESSVDDGDFKLDGGTPDNTVERVIIRKEFDRYNKDWGYLVGFPEDVANPGRICAVRINGDFRTRDCYDEVSLDYFLHLKIVHKNDPVVADVIKALEGFYPDTKFKAIEKVPYADMRRNWEDYRR